MSPRVHSRGRLPGALVALAASIALAASVRAAEPWQFPDAASRSAAARLSNYWYENYPEATRIIESGNADKLDEAIARLRVCIASERESSQRKRNPKDRTNIEYFPYFYLARAFAMKNEPGNAKLCLDKEAQFGEIASSKLAGSFTSLRSSIDALAFAGPLLDHAATVEGWSGGQGGVSLSADGRQRAGNVKSAADALRTALASPQNTGPLQSASDRLMSELTGLCEGELSSLRSRLEQLGGAPWRAAFPSAAAIDPQVCAMPGGAPSPDRIAGAQAAVAACSARAVQAMRTAGGWACGELETKRSQAATLAARLPEIDDPPALPASCNVGWARADLASLQDAIDSLDLAGAQRGYQGQIDRATTLVAERQKEELRGVTATLAKVSRPSASCVSTMRLQRAMQGIAPLPSDPAAGLGIADLDKRVDDAMSGLVGELRSGVDRLRGRSEKGNCSVDLGSLDRSLGAFTRDRRSADLNALCSAAESANRQIRDCWSRQLGLVEAEAKQWRWPLEVTLQNSESWEEAPPEAAAARDCLTTGERTLGSRPGDDPSAWIERVQAEIANAEQCLADYGLLRRAALEELAGRVNGLAEPLGALDCEAPDPTVARFCDLKQQVSGLQAQLAPVSSLWGDGPEDPRRILADAGLESAVPADWLQRHDAAKGEGATDQALVVRRVIGDRMLSGLLTDSAASLASLERVVGVIAPFLALSDAFTAFERGEVNHAIRALREAQSAGAMPPNGKAAALSHAALSYFLFVKSRAGTGDAVTTLLEQDAVRQAREAMQADGSFQLNESLFANVRFRTFFEDCCGNATR